MSFSLIYHTQGLDDYNFQSRDYRGKTLCITVERKRLKFGCTVYGSRDFSTVLINEQEDQGCSNWNKITWVNNGEINREIALSLNQLL